MGKEPEYTSLSAFPGPSDYSVVAPFATDIDTSITGSVFYTESFYRWQINEVSELIRSDTEPSFYGTWMLVAEWHGVPQLHGSSVSFIQYIHSVIIMST